MSYANIEEYFKYYEKQFYHYLVPWVVDDLRNREVVLKTHKEKKKGLVVNLFGNINYLDTAEQQLIRESIDRYFEFLFPEATFPHIELGTVKKIAQNPVVNTYRKRVRSNVLYHVDFNNLYDVIFHYVRGEYKGHEIEEDKGTYDNYIEELNELREEILLKTLEGNIKHKLGNKKHTSYKEFKKPVQNLNLPKDILKRAYERYQTRWEQQIKENGKPHIKRPRPMNAKEYILFNIIDSEDSNDTPKTRKEIVDLAIEYLTGDETLESIYQYYLQQRRIKFASQQRKNITPFNSKMDFGDFMNNIGYKNLKKKIALMNINYSGIPVKEIKNEKPIHEKISINSFPLKENKKYYLHTIAPRYSYIIDLMFENHNQYVYLVAININTRKLWVEPTKINEKVNDDEDEDEEKYIKRVKKELKNGGKSAENVKNALANMMKKGMKVKHLRGDGESAFKSDIMTRFYKRNHINDELQIDDEHNDFYEVSRQPATKYPEFMSENHMVKSIKSEPKHTSLAILDRVIRTIRDLAFNMRAPIIDTKVMQVIVWQYNNAPHATLSKYAGQPVSPNEVDENEELEAFIVRRIQQDNFNIMSQNGFNIDKGKAVKVYNERGQMAKRRSEIEPGKWKVLRRVGHLFEIMDEDGNKQTKSRYQLASCD